MKEIRMLIISLLFAAFAMTSHGQTEDPVLFDSDGILLTQNLQTGNYRLITPNETYEGLKFVKQISYYNFQVLDAENRVFYIGRGGEKKDEIIDPYQEIGFYSCTSLFVQSTDSLFLIFLMDEFCEEDMDELIPEKIYQISTNDVDSVLFINGKSELLVDSTFYGISEIIDPEMFILVKDGKYFTEENPRLKLDSIDFSNYGNSLKTKLGNLYGMLGIVKPKYTKIEGFEFFLAKAEKENNEVVYIDYKGNEYTKLGRTPQSAEVIDISPKQKDELEIPQVTDPNFDHKRKQAYWDLTKLCVNDEGSKDNILRFLDTINTNEDEYVLFYTFLFFLFENDIQFIQEVDWKADVGDLEFILNQILKESYADMDITFPSYFSDDMPIMHPGVLEKFDNPLRERGLQLGFIDNGSDSYTLLIHQINEKDDVKRAVAELGLEYFVISN